MKTKTLITVTVLALLILVGVASAASPELTGARVAVRQGEYKRAVELLLVEIEKKPEVEAYYLLAKSYAEMKDYKSAGEFFVLAERVMDTEKEVKKFAEDMKADRMQYWYEGIKMVQPIFDDAKGYLDDPESAPPQITAESKLEEAISGYSNVDNIFPYHPRTQYFIGVAYELMAGSVRYKNEDGTLTEYKEGEDGQEETREIFDAEYNELPLVKANDAYLLSMEVKMDDMAGDNLDGDFPLNQHINKVISSSAKLDSFDGASRVISDGAEKFPDNPDILYWQARIYETQGEYAEAAVIYESVINTEEGKEFYDAYNALGDIYLNDEFADRDESKAIAFLEKGLEIAPDNFKIIFSLGKAYKEIGKTEKSKEYFALGQSLFKIDEKAAMGKPQDQAIEEFGEPEESFLINTEYRGQEIEVDVAKFTFEDVTFYVRFYDGLSMGWSTARPIGSGE